MNLLGFKGGLGKVTDRQIIQRLDLKTLSKEGSSVDIQAILPVLAVIFTATCLFFGTQNGFYDSDDYHGNGSAH